MIADEHNKPFLRRRLSVIMPTMWRSYRTLSLLSELDKSKFVSEIILINNDASATPELTLDKARIVDPGKNLYVNPSWNLGVSMAKEDYVCFMNDDITPNSVMHLERVLYEVNEGMVIGVHSDSYSTSSSLVSFFPGYNIKGGWGTMMTMMKKDWVDIPEEMKVLCGDDWIADKAESCASVRMPISTEMATTSRDPSLASIRGNDIAFWESYLASSK